MTEPISNSNDEPIVDEAVAKVPKTTRKPRTKSLQSGFSLLARGEPQIWFTGGMLVLCLAMIAWLLGLVLVSGLPSFWPGRLDLLVLSDGGLEIGEPKKLAETDEVGSVGDKAAGLSRYYRTGNFDLTSRHYRWLSPAEVNESGIEQPAWACVVERQEWGLLYGLPILLTCNVELPGEISKPVQRLDELINLLTSISTEDSRERIEKVIAAAEFRKLSLLDDHLRKVLSSGGGQFQAANATGQWHRVTGEAAEKLTALRETWTEASAIVEHLEKQLGINHGLHSRVRNLKYEISRIDASIEKQRAKVRLAEIRSEEQAAVQVEQSQFLLSQKFAFDTRARLIQELKIELPELLSSDAEIAGQAMQLLAAYESTTLQQEKQDVQKQLDAWLEPFAQQPPAILDAVVEYQQRFSQTLTEKMPLNQELEELEQRLDACTAVFAMPAQPQELTVLSASDLADFQQGTIPKPLQEALASAGITVAGIPVVERLGDHLTLMSFEDESGHGHLMASTSDQQEVVRSFLMNENPIEVGEIVRLVPSNQIGLGEKFGVYFDRWREFLLEDPRENTEGGVFPAIWGTIVMTLIMTIVVVPFGVMSALYLREYTKSGPLVSIIRISINNLAGVPSIVYGVFGFSFFCYTIGAYIDGGPKNADIVPWPSPVWFVIAGAVAIMGTAAFFFSFLSSGPSHTQTSAKKIMSRAALLLWLSSLTVLFFLFLKSPFFDGFYREYLPNPTFGKGGLLWAAMTLSLLTLPVVIVATEEALSAVPNSLREGSLACGASKWQTIRRIILPHARPGILTGAILAMARGAGEVAPLMLVGALPTAPDLPLDSEFPFFHGSRSFMHLGYQIYTLGFQSQNSEAAKPMVFTCTLLLIFIVAALNLSAIYLRARLRRRFHGNQF